MISSNIFYQLRFQVAPGASEETRPSSLRPVLLDEFSYPVLPNPKFPDDHVSAGHLSQYQTAFVLAVVIKRAQQRLVFHQVLARQPPLELVDLKPVLAAKFFKIPVRSPIVPHLVTIRDARNLFQPGFSKAFRTPPQQLRPYTVLSEDQLKVLVATFPYHELTHDHEP